MDLAINLHNMIKLITNNNNDNDNDDDNNDEKSVEKKKIDSKSSNKCAGMLVVFTGVRNAEIEDIIVKEGGKIGSSISGKTTLVVAKDTSETSSKLNMAREKGIKIMNITDFIKEYKLQ